MVEAGGRLCQLLGLPRSTGQIFGLLYLSPKALSLDEIARLLSISKASASTGTRQLAAWQAIRQVWIPGDRRDHFECVADLRELLKAAYLGFFQPRVGKAESRLSNLLETLEHDHSSGELTTEEYELAKARLKGISALQSRLRKVLPLAERFL